MLTFHGQEISKGLANSYLAKIKTVVPKVSSLNVNYDYLVQTEQLSTQDLVRLEGLLQAKQASISIKDGFWVMPRLGTLSSWSTKATNVAQCCELGIKRVEQLLRFDFPDCKLTDEELIQVERICHDKMTQSIVKDLEKAKQAFQADKPQSFRVINILDDGMEGLRLANKEWGLALSEAEMAYLLTQYQALGRNPSDVELMMFAQVNSEHCRHKIFKAKWEVDTEAQKESLFDMIRNTSMLAPFNLWSAYHDNAAVIANFEVNQLTVDSQSKIYQMSEESLGTVIKVETHNHPTAIEPYAGAGTGAGGEIRDEGATGIGGKPKAGLSGFSVSHLRIPNNEKSYETYASGPERLASSLDVMLKGPIGAAKFNNEFGRPNICGYFRSFEYAYAGDHYGYHKPIMIAGGMGQIRRSQVDKCDLPVQAPILVLGGPAMNIGLGGGAASSKVSSSDSEALDFASVQRQNPQMQRKCQEVIDALWGLGDKNPILSIHDVGAGGLSNAIPELVEDGERGAYVELRNIPNAESSLSPLGIWCSEAQERYVMVVKPEMLEQVLSIAKREHCPCAVVGMTTEAMHLRVHDEQFDNNPVDVPLSLLLSDAPKLRKRVESNKVKQPKRKPYGPLIEAIEQVIAYPSVASKSFLITIGDRSVGGLVSRDQMVGPYQIPVADCGVTCSSFEGYHGEAMGVGERSPIAVLNARASASMSVGEAITNLMSADIQALGDIKLSCNWMAACGTEQEDKALWDAVEEVGLKLCPALGIAVPVGKDSLSMTTRWDDKTQKAPMSLVVSGFAPVQDVRACLTPELKSEPSRIFYVDLAQGKQRMGGSCYQQIQNNITGATPDIVSTDMLETVFEIMGQSKQQGYCLAYHDKSDGGLITTLLEMSFASRLGLKIDVSELCKKDPIEALLNEELGFVVQIKKASVDAFTELFSQNGLDSNVYDLGGVSKTETIEIKAFGDILYKTTRAKAQKLWSQTSKHMQAIRDCPQASEAEFSVIDKTKAGLTAKVPFKIQAPIIGGAKPKVAILREQGINGQLEMAQAFRVAGFESIDVTTQDLLENRVNLADFQVMAACGGFSYGDVLGAGRGWANTIINHKQLSDMFCKFFAGDTLTLGVCNGCQMLSHLSPLIPGANHWPHFEPNLSNQFEARLSLVKIEKSVSMWFDSMQGALLPIVVSHGEGRVMSKNEINPEQVSLSYISPDDHQPTMAYPHNPNGSMGGVAAVSSTDGRATIMMPHPERVFRTVQMSWHPDEWGEHSPWQQLFNNAAKQFDS